MDVDINSADDLSRVSHLSGLPIDVVYQMFKAGYIYSPETTFTKESWNR